MYKCAGKGKGVFTLQQCTILAKGKTGLPVYLYGKPLEL
jgi:hypothetical protein